jgi:hypothetical protein
LVRPESRRLWRVWIELAHLGPQTEPFQRALHFRITQQQTAQLAHRQHLYQRKPARKEALMIADHPELVRKPTSKVKADSLVPYCREKQNGLTNKSGKCVLHVLTVSIRCVRSDWWSAWRRAIRWECSRCLMEISTKWFVIVNTPCYQ